MASGSGANNLHVLANDLTGILGTLQLISVTTPGSGTAVIDDNGTADPLDDFIVYTPNSSFDQGDQFEYTISNLNGLSTATVTVLETPTPADLGIDLGIHFEDPFDNMITEVTVGDQFYMVVTVQDIRTTVDPADMGAFSAFLDVLYDRGLVSPVIDPIAPEGVAIEYSADYPNVTSGNEGNSNTPGLLNEFGSFTSSFAPLGPNPLEVFRITFQANAAGIAQFLGDPADLSPLHDVLFAEPPITADYTQINYAVSDLTIFDPAGGGGEGEGPDVNGDGYVSPVDALLVIHFLNNGTSSFNNGSGASNLRLDVNRDSYVSPVDALLVIAYLNGSSGEGEGDAEGEGGQLVTSSFTSLSNTAQDDDLLASSPASVLATLDEPVSSDLVATPTTTAVTVLAPVAETTVADWQTRVGEVAKIATADPAAIAVESWESLLDDLAEDVMEAWLNG